MPQGRWITDESNDRTQAPQAVLGADVAADAGPIHARSGDAGHRPARGRGARADGGQDRHGGTGGRAFARLVHRVRALRQAAARNIAFAVLVENGVYGGTYAAPAAAASRGGGAQAGADWSGEQAMKLFSEVEKTIERAFRKWTERAFGPAESDELLLVHRAILEEIEGKVQTRAARPARVSVSATCVCDAGLAGRRPPRAVSDGVRAGRRLESDIRECAESCRMRVAAGFAVEVETAEEGAKGLRDRICHSR